MLLFRALPRALQPGSLSGLVGTLDAFSRDNGPVGGDPAPRPPALAPGEPAPRPVQEIARQRAVAQAVAGARPSPAPQVSVSAPPPVVREVRVVVDGRAIASAVERQQESERIRQGQPR